MCNIEIHTGFAKKTIQEKIYPITYIYKIILFILIIILFGGGEVMLAAYTWCPLFSLNSSRRRFRFHIVNLGN